MKNRRIDPQVADMKGRAVRARRMATGVVAGLTAVVLSACAASNEQEASGSELSGELNGAGASSQEAAVQAITEGFQTAHPSVTVNYDPVGSGSGREQFIAGGVDFAGTDVPLDKKERADAATKCGGEVIEVPTYLSPIAVVFNVPGIDTLNLDADTIAGIFNGDITNWSDQQIVRTNPDVDLPDLEITTVHRSDKSGTTENFTEYLALASDGWPHDPAESWPLRTGEGAEGTSGVVSAVRNGDGTIGYADASQTRGLGIANVKVGNEFVAYSPETASNALAASSRNDTTSDSMLTFTLDRTTTKADTYPLVLVSYQLACTRYGSQTTADLVRAWLEYVASPDGQAASARGAGSAPIPDDIQDDIQNIADMIEAG